MILKFLLAQMLMNLFKHLNINQPVYMAAVFYFISPLEENIHPVDPMGLKIYLQAAKEIDKETEKLDSSVSNVQKTL